MPCSAPMVITPFSCLTVTPDSPFNTIRLLSCPATVLGLTFVPSVSVPDATAKSHNAVLSAFLFTSSVTVFN